MRWNFYTVVFDLETTDTEPHSVIDIGAVILGPHGLPWLEEFQVQVNPGCLVSEFVTGLTGYTNADLADQPDFRLAAERFEGWIETHCPLKKVRLAAWGNYFDVNVLRAQYQRIGREYPFAGTAIDVKTAALMWCAMSGRRTDKLSVEGMAKEVRIEPYGRYHTAITDARATAAIYQTVMNDLSGGVWVGPRQYVQVAARPRG